MRICSEQFKISTNLAPSNCPVLLNCAYRPARDGAYLAV